MWGSIKLARNSRGSTKDVWGIGSSPWKNIETYLRSCPGSRVSQLNRGYKEPISPVLSRAICLPPVCLSVFAATVASPSLQWRRGHVVHWLIKSRHWPSTAVNSDFSVGKDDLDTTSMEKSLCKLHISDVRIKAFIQRTWFQMSTSSPIGLRFLSFKTALTALVTQGPEEHVQQYFPPRWYSEINLPGETWSIRWDRSWPCRPRRAWQYSANP